MFLNKNILENKFYLFYNKCSLLSMLFYKNKKGAVKNIFLQDIELLQSLCLIIIEVIMPFLFRS